jgi:hypothetical protein
MVGLRPTKMSFSNLEKLHPKELDLIQNKKGNTFMPFLF